MAIRLAVPITSLAVMVTFCPFCNTTGARDLSRPVLILGPCRSCRMQMVRPSSPATLRSRRITRACSSCVPWEKFSRATFIPRSISSRIISSLLHAGPIVHTIFALRRAGVGLCKGSLRPSMLSLISSFRPRIRKPEPVSARKRYRNELQTESADSVAH